MTDYNVNDVYGTAMLTNLSISQWTARKLDRRVSDEVANSKNVDTNVGSYYKSLIDPNVLSTIKTLVNEARSYHYQMTLPWSDNGPRILPTDLYFQYMDRMRAYKERYNAAVDTVLNQYPYHREEAKRLLGSMFREEDYPTPDKLAQRYGFHLEVYPLPRGADFRCDIGAEELEEVRESIEASTRQAMQKSVKDAFDRVYQVVAKYTDRLEDEKTVFRDSMVENARELVEILPKLNFVGDPELDRLTQVMRDHLCQYEPETLRTSPQARKQAYDTASAVKSDLDTFFGGGFQ